MSEHRERLNVPVLVGVAAAFDFHTGRIAQAPEWMRKWIGMALPADDGTAATVAALPALWSGICGVGIA